MEILRREKAPRRERAPLAGKCVVRRHGDRVEVGESSVIYCPSWEHAVASSGYRVPRPHLVINYFPRHRIDPTNYSADRKLVDSKVALNLYSNAGGVEISGF